MTTTGSSTVTSVTSVQFCSLYLTGLTHSLLESVPSHKQTLSLLLAHLLMLFGRTKASTRMPTILEKEVLGHIYELRCGGGNIIALNSGCLCVRLETQRRGCLSCFFCLLCFLLSISSLFWCLACLSCSFLAFLFHFLSVDAHLPLIFSYSLFDISF